MRFRTRLFLEGFEDRANPSGGVGDLPDPGTTPPTTDPGHTSTPTDPGIYVGPGATPGTTAIPPVDPNGNPYIPPAPPPVDPNPYIPPYSPPPGGP